MEDLNNASTFKEFWFIKFIRNNKWDTLKTKWEPPNWEKIFWKNILLISIQSTFNFHFSLYKTIVERDWAYIAKREYNYDVTINSLAHGAFFANIVLRIYNIYF